MIVVSVGDDACPAGTPTNGSVTKSECLLDGDTI